MTEGAISQRAYALQRGCSHKAVQKAIATGKIVKGLVKDGAHFKVLPEIADAEWAAALDPNRVRKLSGGQTSAEMLGVKLEPKEPPPLKPPPDIDPEEQETGPAVAGNSLADIRKKQAQVNLHLKAMELKVKNGQLVDKLQVHQALYAVGQEVKAAILAVPDRTIDLILAAGSRNEAHTMLTTALTTALEALADIGNIDLSTK